MPLPGRARTLVKPIIALYSQNQALANLRHASSATYAGWSWLEEMHWLVETDTRELHLTLDSYAHCGEVLGEQALRVTLRNHQSEIVRAGDVVERSPTQRFGAMTHCCRVGLQSAGDKRLCTSGPVHQFEGTAPDHECLRLVGCVSRLIDKTNR
jgi:hypothetical protein